MHAGGQRFESARLHWLTLRSRHGLAAMRFEAVGHDFNRFIDIAYKDGGEDAFPFWGAERSRCLGQVEKGTWWMPRYQEAMKGVGACDKLRGAGKRAMIRRCPNGETRRCSYGVIQPTGWKSTQGTETSKYLQERTSTETPLVVASERGPAQTLRV